MCGSVRWTPIPGRCGFCDSTPASEVYRLASRRSSAIRWRTLEDCVFRPAERLATQDRCFDVVPNTPHYTLLAEGFVPVAASLHSVRAAPTPGATLRRFGYAAPGTTTRTHSRTNS
jgi:hypothetical protein